MVQTSFTVNIYDFGPQGFSVLLCIFNDFEKINL